MAAGDNSWSLIKFQEGQRVSSKSLNLDLLSESSHVDDDILSNTSSSEELAEYSFRSANEGYQVGLGSISDSLATLTGSRSVCEKKREYNWKIKTWQIILLTSLVSVSFSLGIQKAWSLWMVPDGTEDNMTALLHKGGFPSDVTTAVVYSDLNFWATPAHVEGLQDQSMTTTPGWRPSGKYYVDFDNRIAYPMPDEDVVGWKRFETDSMILWYTLKSKIKSLMEDDAIGNLRNSHRHLLVLAIDEAAWIRNRLLTVTDKALKSTKAVWLSCKDGINRSIRTLSSEWEMLSEEWRGLGPRLHESLKRLCGYETKLGHKVWVFRQKISRTLEGMHRRRH